MADTPPGARDATKQGPVADVERIEVAWLGVRPPWLDTEVASSAFDGFSVTPDVTRSTRVVHLARQARATVASIREAHDNVAIVVDLGPASSASSAALLDATGADAALVDSELDGRLARARASELDGKVTVAPSALDLDWHGPEAALTKLTGAHIKRFRRLHRLAHPTVLFVGPYTARGGLDLAIAATYRLRERLEDIRLAAIPLGAVDQKYLDRCEMDALGLGHRGIVEWTCSAEDIRFWYATATVVCCPWREPAEAPVAPVLAAAAARPFVGSDLAVFRDTFRAPGAPALVGPGDVGALVHSLEPLLSNVATADALGAAARSAVESAFSYEAAACRLASLWGALAERVSLDAAA